RAARKIITHAKFSSRPPLCRGGLLRPSPLPRSVGACRRFSCRTCFGSVANDPPLDCHSEPTCSGRRSEVLCPIVRFLREESWLDLDRGQLEGGSEVLLRARCALLLRLQECSLVQLSERLAQLLLRVHHNRPVPGHRLFQRLA